MGNLGGPEILVIMVVALIVLGPNKLPEAARQVGRAITELKKLSNGFQQEMRDAMVDPEVEAAARDFRKEITATPPPKSPPALLADPTPPSGASSSDYTRPQATTDAGSGSEADRPSESESDTAPATPDQTDT